MGIALPLRTIEICISFRFIWQRHFVFSSGKFSSKNFMQCDRLEKDE